MHTSEGHIGNESHEVLHQCITIQTVRFLSSSYNNENHIYIYMCSTVGRNAKNMGPNV